MVVRIRMDGITMPCVANHSAKMLEISRLNMPRLSNMLNENIPIVSLSRSVYSSGTALAGTDGAAFLISLPKQRWNK